MDDIQKFAPVLHTGFRDGYTEKEMKEFVRWCADQGFSGFSAEGKSLEPTDDIDGWFDRFSQGLCFAADASAEAGIDMWLFDEWGYPTGTAGGKTMKEHPEWRSKKLRLSHDCILEQGETFSVRITSHFISAAAWPVGRDTFGKPVGEVIPLLPEDGCIEYTASEGRTRVLVSCWDYDNFRTVGVFRQDPKNDAQGTLDLLCYEGVRYFLSQMHEAYLPKLREHMGTTVRGFFYDEPYLSWPYPYTFDIIDEFIRVKGYDPLPRLCLMLASQDAQLTSDYREVCTDRMAKAFIGQMADWCHAHGVELVGHQDLDHAVKGLDSRSGQFFRNSEFNDAPGVDFIWDQIRPGAFCDHPRFAGSVRRLLGKKHAMSESFAATGLCLSPDYMRFCMEQQAVRGINRFFLMIADPAPEDRNFYTPLSKDHPQSVMFGKKLNRHVALTEKLLDEGIPAGHYAIYVPMKAVASDFLYQQDTSSVSVRPVWEDINEAARVLCYAPADYDYLWDRALLSLPVVNGALETPLGQRIDTIILPTTAAFEDGVIDKLLLFAKEGGRILCFGNPPAELVQFSVAVPDAAALREKITPDLALSGNPSISIASRNIVRQKRFFLLNESTVSADTELYLPACCWEYDFDRECWTDVIDGNLHFAPMELRVFSTCRPESYHPALIPEAESSEIGGFTAILPDGRRLPLPKLCDWREFWQKDYCGVLDYEASFSSDEGTYLLDLSQVLYAAQITVDDEVIALPFAPFRTELRLSSGTHRLKVSVLNTEATRYLGDPEKEAAYRKDPKNASMLRYPNDRNYVRSGLLGPVTLTKLNRPE